MTAFSHIQDDTPNKAPDDREQPTFAIACPSCEYLLHGLGGPVVTCPECGGECNIEELARRYRMRWSTTPLYERLMQPVTVALLLVIFAPVVLILMLSGFDDVIATGAVLLSAMIVIPSIAWLFLSYRAMRGLPIRTGATLLLLLHIVMAGYLACGVGVFAGLIGLIVLPVAIINNASDLDAIVMCAIVTAVGVLCALAFRLLWKLDQHVGLRCLRHSLHEDPEAESDADVNGAN